MRLPVLFIFLKIALVIWNLLKFHPNIVIKICVCVCVCKKCHCILIDIAVKLQMTLGSMGILSRLVLLIHGCGLFPFICVISFLSSNSYSFEYIYILPPCLSLFLNILLF